MKRFAIKLFCTLGVALCCFQAEAQTLNEAKKLYEEEKYAEAKPAFEKFWKQSPSNSSYNLWYGVCCLKTGDLEAAEKPLSFAVKRRQIEAFRYMGDLCFLTYRMEEAVDMYEQYIGWLEKKKRDTAYAEERLDLMEDALRMMRACRFSSQLDFTIEEKGSVNLEEKPEYVPLDTTGWKVTCSDTVFNGYNYNGAAWLLYDGLMHYEDPWMGEWDEEVYFEPAQTLGASIVTVTFDMKTPQTVAGFKVKQPERNESGDKNYLLSSLMIEFSTDNYTWTKATYAEGSATIGNTPAEETFIRVPEDLRTPVRYIRVTMSSRQVSDISGSEIFSLRLGKFIPLKELTLSE